MRQNYYSDAQRINIKPGNVAMYACSSYGPHFHDLWMNTMKYVGCSAGTSFYLPKGYYYKSKDSSQSVIGQYESYLDYVEITEIEVFWVEHL